MLPLERVSNKLRLIEILCLSFIALSFCLLVASHTGEAHTVWEALHPAFMPLLFGATFLLLVVLFTSEKNTQKLLLVIAYSILVHSFFSIVFPAGDLSGQQTILGQTRRVFDDTVLHGLSGWPTTTIQIFVIEMFRGTNLQAALTTIFARMLSIDILNVHLFYVPVLWGVFVPVASFQVARVIGGSEKASILSSLLVSAFPYTIYFGAISVPNSFGFIVFLYSLYFALKYLSSRDSRSVYLMVASSLFSFLSHYLTGVISFSLLFLAVAFKSYEEGEKASLTARFSLVVSFLACASLLPVSFIYFGFFGPYARAAFTLDKLHELPFQEALGLFLIGELARGFGFKTILIFIIGPTLVLISVIYQVYSLKNRPTKEFRAQTFFLVMAFLIILLDYRILKLFMEGLPLNEERLWVFRDFIGAPILALSIYAIVESLKSATTAKSNFRISVPKSKPLSKGNIMRPFRLLLASGLIISLLLAFWTTLSVTVAYPRVAPLQTTGYELEAVRYLEASTKEKYVVIGDVWTIFAGEVIVGTNNPRAYYFWESNETGHGLFLNMTKDPSPKWMLLAMNYTGTVVAYFIVTEPRLGTQKFNDLISRTLENRELALAGVFGDGKLYVFSYKKQ